MVVQDISIAWRTYQSMTNLSSWSSTVLSLPFYLQVIPTIVTVQQNPIIDSKSCFMLFKYLMMISIKGIFFVLHQNKMHRPQLLNVILNITVWYYFNIFINYFLSKEIYNREDIEGTPTEETPGLYQNHWIVIFDVKDWENSWMTYGRDCTPYAAG